MLDVDGHDVVASAVAELEHVHVDVVPPRNLGDIESAGARVVHHHGVRRWGRREEGELGRDRRRDSPHSDIMDGHRLIKPPNPSDHTNHKKRQSERDEAEKIGKGRDSGERGKTVGC
jgi:hypothetical protein